MSPEAGGRKGGDADEKTDLAKRIEIFLGEYRIVTPGLAALLGFQLNMAFQAAYDDLAPFERGIHFAGILSTVGALVFLLMPAAYNRFTSRAEERHEFLRFAKMNVRAAFFFMASTLVLSLYLQAWRVWADRALSAAAAISLLGVLTVVWWVLPLLRARRHGPPPHKTRSS